MRFGEYENVQTFTVELFVRFPNWMKEDSKVNIWRSEHKKSICTGAATCWSFNSIQSEPICMRMEIEIAAFSVARVSHSFWCKLKASAGENLLVAFRFSFISDGEFNGFGSREIILLIRFGQRALITYRMQTFSMKTWLMLSIFLQIFAVEPSPLEYFHVEDDFDPNSLLLPRLLSMPVKLTLPGNAFTALIGFVEEFSEKCSLTA